MNLIDRYNSWLPVKPVDQPKVEYLYKIKGGGVADSYEGFFTKQRLELKDFGISDPSIRFVNLVGQAQIVTEYVADSGDPASEKVSVIPCGWINDVYNMTLPTGDNVWWVTPIKGIEYTRGRWYQGHYMHGVETNYPYTADHRNTSSINIIAEVKDGIFGYNRYLPENMHAKPQVRYTLILCIAGVYRGQTQHITLGQDTAHDAYRNLIIKTYYELVIPHL